MSIQNSIGYRKQLRTSSGLQRGALLLAGWARLPWSETKTNRH